MYKDKSKKTLIIIDVNKELLWKMGIFLKKNKNGIYYISIQLIEKWNIRLKFLCHASTTQTIKKNTTKEIFFLSHEKRIL